MHLHSATHEQMCWLSCNRAALSARDNAELRRSCRCWSQMYSNAYCGQHPSSHAATCCRQPALHMLSSEKVSGSGLERLRSCGYAGAARLEWWWCCIGHWHFHIKPDICMARSSKATELALLKHLYASIESVNETIRPQHLAQARSARAQCRTASNGTVGRRFLHRMCCIGMAVPAVSQREVETRIWLLGQESGMKCQ